MHQVNRLRFWHMHLKFLNGTVKAAKFQKVFSYLVQLSRFEFSRFFSIQYSVFNKQTNTFTFRPTRLVFSILLSKEHRICTYLLLTIQRQQTWKRKSISGGHGGAAQSAAWRGVYCTAVYQGAAYFDGSVASICASQVWYTSLTSTASYHRSTPRHAVLCAAPPWLPLMGETRKHYLLRQ